MPRLVCDGLWLGFFRDSKLLKVALKAERPAGATVVADVSESPRGAAWSVDDTIGCTYAVAPDGRRVLVVRPNEQTPQRITSLDVITNWSDVLERTLHGPAGR